MESAIRKARIEALKAQLEASLVLCNSLVWDIEAANCAEDEAAFNRQWDLAMQQHDAVRAALVILETRERQESEAVRFEMRAAG
jgi:hypothetical protein